MLWKHKQVFCDKKNGESTLPSTRGGQKNRLGLNQIITDVTQTNWILEGLRKKSSRFIAGLIRLDPFPQKETSELNCTALPGSLLRLDSRFSRFSLSRSMGLSRSLPYALCLVR